MRFHDPGAINIIAGRPGTGKTDLSLRILENGRRRDPEIHGISNIPLAGGPSWYHQYTTLSGILWYIVAFPRSVLIIDEAGIYATSGAGGDTDTRGILERLVKICRKFGLSVIWIDQTIEGSVPPKVRQMATWVLKKIQKDRTEIYLGTSDAPSITAHVTRTTLRFNTLGFSSLRMDIKPSDFLGLVDYLSENPGGPIQIRESLGEWLISKDLDPPKIPELSAWSEKREKKEEGGGSAPSTPEEKKIPDPKDKIDTRTLIYGILQRSPRVPARRIAEILRVGEDTVYHYRKEYTRKLKPGGKGSPEPFPEDVEDWSDLPEIPGPGETLSNPTPPKMAES